MAARRTRSTSTPFPPLTSSGLRPRRRSLAAGGIIALAAALGACSPDDGPRVEYLDETPATSVLPAGDAAATALTLSALLFASSDVAVIATEETLEPLAQIATGQRIPLLLGTDQAVVTELDRLGTGTVLVAAGTDASGLGEDLEVIEVDPAAADAADAVPEIRIDQTPTTASLLVDPEQDGPALIVARTLMEAAGGAVGEIPGGDARHSSETVAAAKEVAGEDPSTGVLAFGDTFGSAEQLISTLITATTVPELPGGGQLVFPDRRMIAAYGTPGVPSLGILGEQPMAESIERVQGMAEEYKGLTDEPVIPAFEIITTVASSEPGSDGDYSSPVDRETLREWIDAARQAGVYVVLDLQPGTTDFLTQARMYEELLKEPHVGLALDPEWRLKPGQKHLEQIGSVTAAEVNETSAWLADLTAQNNLPQKLLILHQFSTRMITDRGDVDTSHPELAIALHADGHGTPDLKIGTWEALQNGLPEGIFMAWKNFYDEDTPTFTPEETYEIEPRPWFVSYQ